MAQEVKSPNPYPEDKPLVFLAGAIDMGEAEDWQSQVVEKLAELDVVLLNPRRDDWDSTWEQDKSNPEFLQQVTWEQDGLDAADLILVVMTKESKAPITLMELGEHVNDNVLVCCPQGFYRKGNVDIVCDRHNIPVFESLDELIAEAIAVLSTEPKTAAAAQVQTPSPLPPPAHFCPSCGGPVPISPDDPEGTMHGCGQCQQKLRVFKTLDGRQILSSEKSMNLCSCCGKLRACMLQKGKSICPDCANHCGHECIFRISN